MECTLVTYAKGDCCKIDSQPFGSAPNQSLRKTGEAPRTQEPRCWACSTLARKNLRRQILCSFCSLAGLGGWGKFSYTDAAHEIPRTTHISPITKVSTRWQWQLHPLPPSP